MYVDRIDTASVGHSPCSSGHLCFADGLGYASSCSYSRQWIPLTRQHPSPRFCVTGVEVFHLFAFNRALFHEL